MNTLVCIINKEVQYIKVVLLIYLMVINNVYVPLYTMYKQDLKTSSTALNDDTKLTKTEKWCNVEILS